jgi:hypothetical protein
MNTGIQDAVNLGWKLAFATPSSDSEGLLASYQVERRPVARRLLALTHFAFLAEASSNSLLSLLRGVLAPLGAPVIPVLAGHRMLVAEVIRVVSQWRMGYPNSNLSIDGDPPATIWPRPGHRLPDESVTCEGQITRLHTLMARAGIHVLLGRDAARIENLSLGPHVTVHRLTSAEGTGLVAVRPDGYVGFRCGIADEIQLRSWLRSICAGA